MFLHSSVLFFSFDSIVFYLFVLYVFVCFYLCISFFLCRSLGFPSHPKNEEKNRKIPNPNSKIQIKNRRSVSAHPSAQQLRPQRLKPLNPLLQFILVNKISCLPFFSCHQSCGVFFCAVHWISQHVPKCQKKNRESSP